MTSETAWRDEWQRLRAERDLARRRWRRATDGLAARSRDPLGLGRIVRDHPAVAGGIGAAAAALLVKLFLGGARPQRDVAADGDGAARPTSAWKTVLRDAALSVAVPWLVRTLTEKFGAYPATRPDERAASAAPPRN